MKRTMWVLCEAFTLTGDAFAHETIHRSLAPWAGVYPTREACIDALAGRVGERVGENYEGLDDADDDISADIAEVMDGFVQPDRGNDGYRRYNYSTDDREVVWRVYPTEVEA